MILPDVNVLVYAFRRDAPQHPTCRGWLNRLIEGNSHFGMSPLALAAVVRVTTSRKFFPQPSAVNEAFGFADNLLGQPHCQVIEPGDSHWGIFERLCIETNTTGPRVTDAWYAALAIEADCEWITLDRDFVRFPGLHISAPAA